MALGYYVVEMVNVNAKLYKFGGEIEKDSMTMKKAIDAGLKLVKNIKGQKSIAMKLWKVNRKLIMLASIK